MSIAAQVRRTEFYQLGLGEAEYIYAACRLDSNFVAGFASH